MKTIITFIEGNRISQNKRRVERSKDALIGLKNSLTLVSLIRSEGFELFWFHEPYKTVSSLI